MGAEPAYVRIREDVRSRILSEEYEPEARIPSEASLAERYGVTRMTVRHAVSGLVRDGMLVRRQGSGTFVASKDGRSLNRLASFTEDLLRQGYAVRTEVLFCGDVLPPDDVRDALGLEPGALTVRLDRLRSTDEQPVSVSHTWLPLAQFPGLVLACAKVESLYALLERQYRVRPSRARQRLTAVAASPELARLLQIELGSPLVKVQRLTQNQDSEFFELARSWSIPSIPLVIDLTR